MLADPKNLPHRAVITLGDQFLELSVAAVYDKAGAYGIQEWIGYVGISSIEGSFYNVMGFPVHRVWHELQRFL